MAPGPLLPETITRVAAAMERPVELGPAAANNSANQNLHPLGMQIYWNLSSLNMEVREAAALALVRELREKQEEFAAGGGRGGVAEVLGAKDNDGMLEGCAPAVQYSLRRLVRGLGSSRECARQGFSTALTTVIGALPVLRGESLLRIIPSNLEVTSSMKKQDARDGLLGRLFAYGSLVRSKRLVGDGTNSEEKELAREIVEQLFNLATQKTFLREPAVNLVIELASGETVCASSVYDEWLRRGIESQSPEALLLVLELHEKLPAQSCPFVPETGNLQDLFEPSHLVKLIPCLKESSSSHPRVHSVWRLILDRLFSPAKSLTQASSKKNRAKSGGSKDANYVKRIETDLANLWSVVVDGALLTSSHERKSLAMELLLLVLPRLPTPESVGIVLSNIFVRCIIDILSSKDTLLHKSAERCLGELRLWAESSNLRRAAVIVGLQKNSYGKFDTLSKSPTVKALTNGLTTEDGALAFVQSLKELFLAVDSSVVKVPEELVKGSEEAEVNGIDKIAANDRIWIVEQMCALCRQLKLVPATAQASVYREVIKFLVAHSLFEANNQQKAGEYEKNEFRWPQKSLTLNLRKLFAERLHSILVTAEHWVAAQTPRSGNAGASGVNETVVVDEDFSHFAALCCLRVQKSPDAVLLQSLTAEAAESVKILQLTVTALSSAVKSETDVDRLKRILALRSLLSVLLLESFLEPGSTDDIAAELSICCSRGFPESLELSNVAPPVKVEEGSEDAPPVMDVLLDVLLSLLAKGSSPVREAAEKVFKVYCKDLTRAGMTDVLRILNKGFKSGRHKSMIEDGEDDTDDDDDILEDEGNEETEGDFAQDNEEGEDEDEDEDDQEDDDDEEEDVEMGDGDGDSRTLQQQMRFKRSGEDLDNEPEGSDSDVSDMDDEAMFRADVLLANVLKQKKLASKNNAQTELAHFKFRVLSLLECFLQKHPGSSLVLLAVQGLVKAFVSTVNQLGTAPEENEVLVKRLETLLQSRVLKVKIYPREKDVDLPLTRRLLEQSWKLASRSSIKRVRDLARGCALWALKVLLGNVPDIEENGVTELSAFLSNSLEDFFSHRKSRLPGPFLAEVFQRFPILGRLSVGMLIEKAGNGRTGVMKCEAMRLLTGILKPTISGKGKKTALESAEIAKAFEEHVGSLGAVILTTVQSPPQKAAHKLTSLQFCSSCIDAFRLVFPRKALHSVMDLGALLAGLKAIDAPSKGKLRNLITKLVEIVTVEEAMAVEVLMKSEADAAPSKRKKGKKTVTPTHLEEGKTVSKRKKARAETEKLQGENSPSKKRPQTPSKKLKVTKDST